MKIIWDKYSRLIIIQRSELVSFLISKLTPSFLFPHNFVCQPIKTIVVRSAMISQQDFQFGLESLSHCGLDFPQKIKNISKQYIYPQQTVAGEKSGIRCCRCMLLMSEFGPLYPLLWNQPVNSRTLISVVPKEASRLWHPMWPGDFTEANVSNWNSLWFFLLLLLVNQKRVLF